MQSSERTPFHFRPMDELQHEDPVEMVLTVSGRVVTGRLIRGIVTPASRTFVQWVGGTWVACKPFGWRDIIPPEVLADWQRGPDAGGPPQGQDQAESGKVAA